MIEANVVDMTGWKTFKKRIEFKVLVHRLACEDEAIQEICDAARIEGFIPQNIKVARAMDENAISNIEVDCRPESDISGEVLCTVSGPDRPQVQWYSLEGRTFGQPKDNV